MTWTADAGGVAAPLQWGAPLWAPALPGEFSSGMAVTADVGHLPQCQSNVSQGLITVAVLDVHVCLARTAYCLPCSFW